MRPVFLRPNAERKRGHMSIKEQLKATPQRGKEITGHDLEALERFAEDTRHMIIFDVLTWVSHWRQRQARSYLPYGRGLQTGR